MKGGEKNKKGQEALHHSPAAEDLLEVCVYVILCIVQSMSF